jgi:hypothetical protein
MYEYKSKLYVEPAVSYFDGKLEADKTLISALGAVAAIALVSALATSARGSENPLER